MDIEQEELDIDLIVNSKENIKPIKNGRSVRKLVKTLKDVDKTSAIFHQKNILKKERKEYENKIKTYKGKDPIKPWLKYIKWTLNTFISGGSKSYGMELVEKCSKKFKSDELYTNDIRFLKLWITYADMVEKPKSIFTYLRTNRIGQVHALFFEAWATFMENDEEYSFAEKILEKGISSGAQPVEHLKYLLKEFQGRMSRRIKEQIDNGIPNNNNNVKKRSNRNNNNENNGVERRAALGTVNAYSRHGLSQFGVNNTSRNGSSTSMNIPTVQSDSSSNFQIFTDDLSSHNNKVRAEDVLLDDDFKGMQRHLATQKEINKENKRKVSKWNKALYNDKPNGHEDILKRNFASHPVASTKGSQGKYKIVFSDDDDDDDESESDDGKMKEEESDDQNENQNTFDLGLESNGPLTIFVDDKVFQNKKEVKRPRGVLRKKKTKPRH